MKFLRHLLAILLLPGVVTILVPALLVRSNGAKPGWGWTWPLNLLPVLAGVGLIGGGLWLMSRTISLFATVGQGTLAPWDPPRQLVVRGIYRHVRNPMMTGVWLILIGEAALFGSRAVLNWWLIFAALNLIVIPLVEEPMLVRRFGDDYRLYRANVPAWIPRLHPWEPPDRNR